MNKKNKILMISYHFPPSNEVGGKRTAIFAKYLPNFNWEPIVLTIKEKYLEGKDWSLLPDSNEVKIYRTIKIPSIIEAYTKLSNAIKNHLGSRDKIDEQLLQRNFMQESHCGEENVSARIRRYIYSLFISLPDFERNWVIPAVLKSLWLIRKKNIECIMTSAPPHSVHLIGLAIKSITQVHWVCDYRDPWMTPFTKGLYHTCKLSNSIERYFENKVIKNADLIICNTELLADNFKERFNAVYRKRLKFLPNGFDPELFDEIQGSEKYDIFTICYTGTLYLGRTPEPIFIAIRELINDKKISAEDIRIKLVGNCQHFGRRAAIDVISEYELNQVVEIVGQVPHKECLKIIKKSHLALLLSSGQPYQIPAKVYDYIGAGTSIMAIAEYGASEKLVNKLNNGKVIRENDIVSMKDYLIKCMKRTDTTNIIENKNRNQYNSRTITEVLAEEIRRIIDERRKGRPI